MKKREENSAVEVMQTCQFAAEGGDEHEPPIGVGVGSCFFDLPNEIKLDRPTGMDGYQKYNFASNQSTHTPYTAIAAIAVINERRQRSRGITFEAYRVNESQQAKLRLWLSNTKDEPTSSQPDIIIDGVSGGSISTKQSLNTTIMLPKSNRKTRHLHQNSDLCVVKWELVDRAGTVLSKPDGTPCRESRDDLYYIYVSFYHA